MFSGGPSLSARLANIQHIPVLMAATVASNKSIEPYLVKDILKMSFESGQARAFLQQYLLNQLVTSRNVYVKFKVLKLLEELLEKGHIEFKQNLRKQPEPLNEASRLRAIHTKDGGIVTECSRIRDLSNKLLERLYSDAPEMQPKRYPPPEIRSSTSEGSGSTGGMEGFGNSYFGGPKTKSSSATTDKLKALFGSSTKTPSSGPMVYDESYATMDPVPHNAHPPTSGGGGGGGGRYGGYSSTAGYSPGRYLEQGVPEGAPHRSGEAGGGWDTGSPTDQSPPAPQPTEETLQHEDYHILPPAAEESEVRNMEQERRLVDDITAPGGVKAAPPRDSLNRFISRCRVLDTLAVLEFLRQKLQDQEQTQVVLRTLFVVEAMMKSDIPEVFFHLDLFLAELHVLTSSPNPTIRAKAKKIMQQLAAEEGRSAVSSNDSGGGVSGGVPSGAILDLEGGTRDKAEHEEHPNEPPPESMAGIFAGMSLSGQLPSGSASGGGVPPASSTHQERPQLGVGGGQAVAASPFGDLLGLNSSSAPPPPPPSSSETFSHIKAPRTDGGEGVEPSLMDLGDDRDENFDPLSGNESQGSRSDMLAKSPSLGNQRTAPPTSSSSNGVMGDLSGLDLTLTSQTDTRLLNGIGPNVMQSYQLDSSLVSSSSVSTAAPGPAPLLPGVGHSPSPAMVMVGGAYSGAQMPGRVAYVAPGSVPYGVQPGPSLPPQGGMPLYPNPQGAPIMYLNNQPGLGGDARPVQRPQVTDNTDSSSSFDFLSKSGKGSAFDFVKEEIDSAKKK